ncbi:Septin-domain-containing protein [Lobosporangium transversale]|uniref:Septin-domain-containing protein n=1 Tax=Lobosporangium transversale TaxID=64571 RepID=A0A1Y2H3N3_9FUNG|nr:Septin-domain-containing protein [Lobosporangium transversale]ORZ28601.1 Septin-domain-containing protein [Lobosporangium transversale]|eukprot:XP_021886274.1 Septin-domain-containing protein [Lobosporangium transversale]
MPLEFAHQHNGQFPDVGPWRHPEARPLQLSAPLGLETLPGQRFTKVKRKAFDLNLMVVGESGLGKTTFMNTLFNSNLKEEIPVKKIHSSQTVEITPSYYELVEDGVLLNLCVVDTPGFGDELNRERNLAPIIEYIDRQYEEYMAAERHPGFRKTIPDTRIHAVLYFLAPTGHGLKELDVRALKNLSEKANVIPLIAKGDTMTAEEKVAFKSLLLRDLEEYQIRTFPSSYPDEVDDAEELLKHIPFSVIGSDSFALVGNMKVRARSYRWGIVEVENPEHSDFVHLRELLLATCLHDLVECTHGTHYHAFRAKALRSRGRPTSILKCDDSYESQIMDARQRNRQEMERKEEEIRQKFIEKVQEKETALREREEQLNAKKAEMVAELEQYKVLLEKEQRELDELIANSRSNTLSKSTSKLNKAK